MILITSLVIVPEVIVKPMIKDSMDKSTFDISEFVIKRIESGGKAYVDLYGELSLSSSADSLDGMTIETKETWFDVTLVNPDEFDAGKQVMGRLRYPYQKTKSDKVTVDVETEMMFLSDKMFHVLMQQLLENPTVSVYFEGDVEVTVSFPSYYSIFLFSSVTVTDKVKMSKEVLIEGMENGLNFTSNQMLLADSEVDFVAFEFNTTLYNTGIVTTVEPFVLYNVDISAYYNNVYIGKVMVDTLSLGDDVNGEIHYLLSLIYRTEANAKVLEDLFSNYILGEEIDLVVNGTVKVDIGLGRNDEYAVFMDIDWPMETIVDPIIVDVRTPTDEIEFDRDTRTANVAIQALTFNPLDFEMTVSYLTFSVYVRYCERNVGQVITTYSPVIPIEGRGYACLNMTLLDVVYDDLLCILAAINDQGMLVVDVQGYFVVGFDLFSININFDFGPLEGYAGRCQLPKCLAQHNNNNNNIYSQAYLEAN